MSKFIDDIKKDLDLADARGVIHPTYPASDMRKVISDHEAAVAELEAELEIAREEIAVKCKDCNRHKAFEENVRLEDELAKAREEIQAAKDAIRIVHGLNQAEALKEEV